MDALSNILLQRYQQQAYLMSGFAFPAPLSKTNNTGLQSLTGVQQTQPGTQLTSSLMTTGGVTAISALGKQLSEFSRALGNDQEARTGLRAFALESGRNQFAAGGLSAMADLQSMRLESPQTFKSAFVTAGQIANAGGSVTPFMQTLANQPTQETQSSLIKSISETMKMNGTAAERRQVASSILSTVSDIQKNATGETQTSMMSSFLSKINETNTLNARSEFITIFRRREQSVFSA